jgi:hypothetical protein
MLNITMHKPISMLNLKLTCEILVYINAGACRLWVYNDDIYTFTYK